MTMDWREFLDPNAARLGLFIAIIWGLIYFYYRAR